jgi:hypothetical protein
MWDNKYFILYIFTNWLNSQQQVANEKKQMMMENSCCHANMWRALDSDWLSR